MSEAETIVVDKRVAPYDVYIGRGSPFGNPYSHVPSQHNTIRTTTRDGAIELYRIWLTTDHEIPGWTKPTRAQIMALRGKRLGCFCAPQRCHGDVLVAIIDTYIAEEP